MTVIVGKGSSGSGISTHTFRDEVLQVRRLDSIHAAGFRPIELLANRPHLDCHSLLQEARASQDEFEGKYLE